MTTRTTAFGAYLLTVLCLFNPAQASETLEIIHPWVREAPPTSSVLAAYMSIKNTSDSTIAISSISSAGFESAEIHRTVIKEGMATMLHIEQLDVPAKGQIDLKPGGLHLMLFNPHHALKAGDSVTLLVHLDNGTCLTVNAPVIRQTGENSSQHHH